MFVNDLHSLQDRTEDQETYTYESPERRAVSIIDGYQEQCYILEAERNGLAEEMKSKEQDIKKLKRKLTTVKVGARTFPASPCRNLHHLDF